MLQEVRFCHFPFDVEPDRLQICAVNSQGERSDPADVTHVVDKPKPFYVHALFDYVAESMSPNLNRSTELSFRRGDTLKITGPIRHDGFYTGEDGQNHTGLIPSNFVQPIDPQPK